MRHAPLFAADWLVPHSYRDDLLGVLKSGKESEVYLVARSDRSRTSYLAEKRFKSRAGRSFRDDALYVDGGPRSDRREARAMRARTRFGIVHLETSWIEHEWHQLVRLHAAGVTVPPPVERVDGGYRMAFVGDGGVAAPRLSSLRLAPHSATDALSQLLDEIRAMLAADRVHGDLSEYNVLWWRDRAVLIDFSQTVDVITHAAARTLLARDVERLCSWGRRQGIAVDEARVWREIGAEAALTGRLR